MKMFFINIWSGSFRFLFPYFAFSTHSICLNIAFLAYFKIIIKVDDSSSLAQRNMNYTFYVTNLQPQNIPNFINFLYPIVCTQHALKYIFLLYISCYYMLWCWMISDTDKTKTELGRSCNAWCKKYLSYKYIFNIIWYPRLGTRQKKNAHIQPIRTTKIAIVFFF